MPKFAANLSLMYPEFEFLDRFSAAAEDGFRGVEILFPYEHRTAAIKARLDASGLALVLCNCPPGDPARGDRGLAALPGRTDDFKRAFDLANQYADALDVACVHVMAGLTQAETAPERQHETFVANLRWAAEQLSGRRRVITIEPINTRDVPGYFLNRQDAAHAICAATGSERVKVQMDVYHCQIVEGDLASRLRSGIGRIGHIQVAGVPDRHEPNTGEVNYPYLFALLDELAYDGWVAGEYRPAGKTRDGLGWRHY